MANACACGKLIRANAKRCTLCAASHGMQYGTPTPACANPTCGRLLPWDWFSRSHGRKPLRYCCNSCKRAVEAARPWYAERRRAASKRYRDSLKALHPEKEG